VCVLCMWQCYVCLCVCACVICVCACVPAYIYVCVCAAILCSVLIVVSLCTVHKTLIKHQPTSHSLSPFPHTHTTHTHTTHTHTHKHTHIYIYIQALPNDCPEGPERVTHPRVTKNWSLLQIISVIQTELYKIISQPYYADKPELKERIKNVVVCVVCVLCVVCHV